MLQNMGHDRCKRAGWLIFPHSVERVLIKGHKFGTGFKCCRFEADDIVYGVEPRVVGEALACFQILGKPISRGQFNHVMGLEGA